MKSSSNSYGNQKVQNSSSSMSNISNQSMSSSNSYQNMQQSSSQSPSYSSGYQTSSTTSNSGHQHIGCNVASCKFNDKSSCCSLSSISVMPCTDQKSNTGNPADESMCGSYSCK